MGKISKALEKAGLDDRFKRTMVEAKMDTLPHAKAAPEPKAFREPVKPVEALTLAENAPAKEQAAPTAPPVAVVKSRAPAPSSPSIPEAQATEPNRAAEPEAAAPSAQPQHLQKKKKSTAVSPPRPAEVAAPERRPDSSPSAPPPAGKGYAPLSDMKVTSRGDLKINYSHTRIQPSDPERLKDNKIFSIFDDIETTEQIKILRTQVLKKLEDIGGNSILITSANPYEGKTFTSINLGVSIAKEFKRTVLIIDADLRKPTKRHTAFSTEFFSLDVEVGLTDYLQGNADIPDILINPGIKKLTLIPSGKPVNNAPELLSSTQMADMMEEIKNRYPADRLVIVDGPALLPFPDALILSRYVDAVLPVVEVGRTPADKLKKMMEMLKETNVIGTVMNKSKE